MTKSQEMYLANLATADFGRLMDERNSLGRCIARATLAGEPRDAAFAEMLWRFGAVDARISG